MISTTNPHANRKPRNISDAEWEVRVQLAAAYRMAAKFQLTDLIYTHISVRVPGRHDQYGSSSINCRCCVRITSASASRRTCGIVCAVGFCAVGLR